LVDTIVGPDRDVSLRTLQRPQLEPAQRNLRSLELRNAALAELMSYDPAASFTPRTGCPPTTSVRRVGQRSDMDRKVQPTWVGE
jgi:hypothetical protein